MGSKALSFKLREKVAFFKDIFTWNVITHEKGSKSRLSLIVRVNVVLNRTVVVDSD